MKHKIHCRDIPERELLEAIVAFQESISDGNYQTPFPYEMLAHKYPEKVTYKKMEKLDNKGLINYGVSLRTAWVEPERIEAAYPDLADRARKARERSMKKPFLHGPFQPKNPAQKTLMKFLTDMMIYGVGILEIKKSRPTDPDSPAV